MRTADEADGTGRRRRLAAVAEEKAPVRARAMASSLRCSTVAPKLPMEVAGAPGCEKTARRNVPDAIGHRDDHGGDVYGLRGVLNHALDVGRGQNRRGILSGGSQAKQQRDGQAVSFQQIVHGAHLLRVLVGIIREDGSSSCLNKSLNHAARN